MKHNAPASTNLCILRRMKARIAEIRNRRGWSQEQLAERAGMSKAVIQKYEQNKGGLAALDKIETLAEALEVHPLVLLSEEAEQLLSSDRPRVNAEVLAAALAAALETAQKHDFRLSPQKITEMALLLYQSGTEEPNRG